MVKVVVVNDGLTWKVRGRKIIPRLSSLFYLNKLLAKLRASCCSRLTAKVSKLIRITPKSKPATTPSQHRSAG